MRLKLVYWAIITLSVSRTYGTSYILFTRMYQCQGKPYGKCWMMLHGNVSWPPREYLSFRIAVSGPHPWTDLYTYFSLPESVIPIIVMSGFRKCSIYPLNPGEISDRQLTSSHKPKPANDLKPVSNLDEITPEQEKLYQKHHMI